MRFTLIDRVLEDDEVSLVAVKNVSAAEEYLADHFPGFPILPGVFMLEAIVQACREHLRRHPVPGLDARRAVLGSVRALKYGAMVPPGSVLTVRVTRGSPEAADYKARAEVALPGGEARTAAQGRVVLRAPLTGRATGTEPLAT